MAFRTTDFLVREIIENCKSISMIPHINTANVLVNWLVGKDSAANTPPLLDDVTATEIEKQLAAHFYEHRDRQIQQEMTGRASAGYQGQTAMMLTSTLYGQTALMLDPTGFLAEKSADSQTGLRRVASAMYLGRNYGCGPNACGL